MGGRYGIVRGDNGRLVLKGRRTHNLLRSLASIAGFGFFLLVAVPVVVANFSLDGLYRAVVSISLAILFILLPLAAAMITLFRSLAGLIFPGSWEFNPGTDRILRNGRRVFGTSQVTRVSIRRALGTRPFYSLILNLRDAEPVTLDQVRDLQTLRPVAEALASSLGVEASYPGDDEPIGNIGHDRFVIVNPRLPFGGAMLIGAFFTLWYALTIPAFVKTAVAGNPLLAAFVLIFVVAPLPLAMRFWRAFKRLFRAEHWVFDCPSNSVMLNNRMIARFHEIAELQLNTAEDETIEHELGLVKNNGKRFVVTRASDLGTAIARQASEVSRLTGVEITRNAESQGWRDSVKRIVSS